MSGAVARLHAERMQELVENLVAVTNRSKIPELCELLPEFDGARELLRAVLESATSEEETQRVMGALKSPALVRPVIRTMQLSASSARNQKKAAQVFDSALTAVQQLVALRSLDNEDVKKLVGACRVLDSQKHAVKIAQTLLLANSYPEIWTSTSIRLCMNLILDTFNSNDYNDSGSGNIFASFVALFRALVRTLVTRAFAEKSELAQALAALCTDFAALRHPRGETQFVATRAGGVTHQVSTTTGHVLMDVLCHHVIDTVSSTDLEVLSVADPDGVDGDRDGDERLITGIAVLLNDLARDQWGHVDAKHKANGARFAAKFFASFALKEQKETFVRTICANVASDPNALEPLCEVEYLSTFQVIQLRRMAGALLRSARSKIDVAATTRILAKFVRVIDAMHKQDVFENVWKALLACAFALSDHSEDEETLHKSLLSAHRVCRTSTQFASLQPVAPSVASSLHSTRSDDAAEESSNDIFRLCWRGLRARFFQTKNDETRRIFAHAFFACFFLYLDTRKTPLDRKFVSSFLALAHALENHGPEHAEFDEEVRHKLDVFCSTEFDEEDRIELAHVFAETLRTAPQLAQYLMRRFFDVHGTKLFATISNAFVLAFASTQEMTLLPQYLEIARHCKSASNVMSVLHAMLDVLCRPMSETDEESVPIEMTKLVFFATLLDDLTRLLSDSIDEIASALRFATRLATLVLHFENAEEMRKLAKAISSKLPRKCEISLLRKNAEIAREQEKARQQLASALAKYAVDVVDDLATFFTQCDTDGTCRRETVKFVGILAEQNALENAAFSAIRVAWNFVDTLEDETAVRQTLQLLSRLCLDARADIRDCAVQSFFAAACARQRAGHGDEFLRNAATECLDQVATAFLASARRSESADKSPWQATALLAFEGATKLLRLSAECDDASVLANCVILRLKHFFGAFHVSYLSGLLTAVQPLCRRRGQAAVLVRAETRLFASLSACARLCLTGGGLEAAHKFVSFWTTALSTIWPADDFVPETEWAPILTESMRELLSLCSLPTELWMSKLAHKAGRENAVQRVIFAFLSSSPGAYNKEARRKVAPVVAESELPLCDDRHAQEGILLSPQTLEFAPEIALLAAEVSPALAADAAHHAALLSLRHFTLPVVRNLSVGSSVFLPTVVGVLETLRRVFAATRRTLQAGGSTEALKRVFETAVVAADSVEFVCDKVLSRRQSDVSAILRKIGAVLRVALGCCISMHDDDGWSDADLLSCGYKRTASRVIRRASDTLLLVVLPACQRHADALDLVSTLNVSEWSAALRQTHRHVVAATAAEACEAALSALTAAQKGGYSLGLRRAAYLWYVESARRVLRKCLCDDARAGECPLPRAQRVLTSLVLSHLSALTVHGSIDPKQHTVTDDTDRVSDGDTDISDHFLQWLRRHPDQCMHVANATLQRVLSETPQTFWRRRRCFVATQRPHLLRLYPLLCLCTRVRDHEIQERAQQLLLLVGTELGVVLDVSDSLQQQRRGNKSDN